jgi:glycosyltransferase involved in cell wall biosynthesis
MGLLEELCERLIKEELPFELHLAGSGPWQEKWQELAAKDQRIIFHGVLKHTEAYRFYEEIHAIVLPSLTRPFWKEQFGRVIIEATASGRAVIGSSSGAIPEVMKQVGMPFNFQEGDLEDLLKKVKSCYDLFLSSKMDDVLKRSQQLSFELYDHQSVAARAQDYLKNPEGNHGLITNSELSS